MGKQSKKPALCVDLDGTLIRTDVTFETFVRALSSSLFNLFLLPWWLLFGRARLKREISARVEIDPALLPYHEKFLEFLKVERRAGREIVLATASDQRYADQIAKHTGVFDRVLGSDGERNLKGRNKAETLSKLFGAGEFVYAGNHPADYAVWKAAKAAIVVSPSRAFIKKVESRYSVEKSFYVPARPWATVRALRFHQWVKNLLVFVPIVMAHRLTDMAALGGAFVAFIAFSLCASGVYLINDLVDLDSDRRHRSKRNRPLASGDVPIPHALISAPLLLAGAAVSSVRLPSDFLVVLSAYFCLTLGYSLALKRIPVLDIMVLAALYGLRIFAGGYAAQIMVSHWLLAFSMFFFLSLACVKRFSELLVLRNKNGGGEEVVSGRGYREDDLELVGVFGAVSGYISVLVMALYISSREVTMLYHHPDLLWSLCLLVLFWISRIWIICHRGEMHDDPIVFALRDRVSYAVGVLCGIVLWAAI